MKNGVTPITRAVTGWVRSSMKPSKGTHSMARRNARMNSACRAFDADVFERNDGLIKIEFPMGGRLRAMEPNSHSRRARGAVLVVQLLG